MPEIPFQDRVTTLQAVLQPSAGTTTPEKPTLPELEELKRWLDDSRLEVWGKLRAAHQPTVPEFEARFRIRRAVDLCNVLTAEFRAGPLNAQLAEAAILGVAALELSQAIRTARG